MTKLTQEAAILKHLKGGKWLTPLEALGKFSCFRLSARIKDLRNKKHPIQKENVSIGDKSFARYRLVK